MSCKATQNAQQEVKEDGLKSKERFHSQRAKYLVLAEGRLIMDIRLAETDAAGGRHQGEKVFGRGMKGAGGGVKPRAMQIERIHCVWCGFEDWRSY